MKEAFDARVDASSTCVAEDDAKVGEAVPCGICMDGFRVCDVVCCGSGDGDLHALCRPCFRQLCVQFASDKGCGPSGVACPTPKCCATFSASDVRANVSRLDLMQMDEREREAKVSVVSIDGEFGTFGVFCETGWSPGVWGSSRGVLRWSVFCGSRRRCQRVRWNSRDASKLGLLLEEQKPTIIRVENETPIVLCTVS